jgi:hypothetical protein
LSYILERLLQGRSWKGPLKGHDKQMQFVDQEVRTHMDERTPTEVVKDHLKGHSLAPVAQLQTEATVEENSA